MTPFLAAETAAAEQTTPKVAIPSGQRLGVSRPSEQAAPLQAAAQPRTPPPERARSAPRAGHSLPLALARVRALL
jgi:hypothetical protein